MAKKKKKPRRPEAPALSKLDTAIYIVWIIFCTVGVLLGYIWALKSISNDFPARNPDLLLCRQTGSMLCILVSGLSLFPGFLISVAPFSMRQPIFGRTDISYGYPYDASLYPLLLPSRQKRAPAAAAKREHKRIRNASLGCIVLFLLLFLAGLLCTAPRWELEADGSMTHYNCFNQPTRYERRDLSSVEIDTDYYVTKHSSGWRVLLTVTTKDGRNCRFSTTRDFSDMLVYKNIVPDTIVTISGQNRVPDVVVTYQNYAHWTEREIDALYELFELSY